MPWCRTGKRVVAHSMLMASLPTVKAKVARAVSDGAEELDPLFDQAVQFVTEKRKASISGVQRQFRIGYEPCSAYYRTDGSAGDCQRTGGTTSNREVLAPPPFD